MATGGGRVNRGPAAAPDNRQALLAAARRVFAARGYQVPYSAIAREAGVGQGVLYRHFPARLDLAFAVFEDNFAELEQIAEDFGPQVFPRLWSRLLDLTLESAAFVEMVLDARSALPEYHGTDRLLALVDATLPAAQHAGLADPLLTSGDVLIAWRMVFGVIATTSDPVDVVPAVERARRLLPLP